MNTRMTVTSVITAGLAAAIVLAVVARRAATRPSAPEPSLFSRAVDLTPLERIAVYDNGRLKSFPSFASTMMHYVSGPHEIAGQRDTQAFLDLMFRPQEYADTPAIFVKNKPLRGEMIRVLQRSPATSPERDAELETFRKSGLISQLMLFEDDVQSLLDVKRRDLIRTSNAVNAIEQAVSVMRPDVLRGSLRIIPPPSGDEADPWLTVEQYTALAAPHIDQTRRASVVTAWTDLADGWRARNAEQVSLAAGTLGSLIPVLSADGYPDQKQLGLESWYFKSYNMVWVWMIYLLSVALLLMAVVYQWPAARWVGLGIFLVALGFHTASIWIRWKASGRWPNTNMFEAVTTAVWFGGCGAVLLEIIARRTAMRNIFALGSAVASMVALMCTHFMPVYLNPNISNRMPVLHDVWLYIHTNVIIFSYVLIAMAAVSAFLYLVYRIGGGSADFVRVGGAGALIISNPQGGRLLPAGDDVTSRSRTSAGQVFDGATMVLMEISFILLWAGLVMGAIWADHSWGRPWGWDPKEVFALNTFLILALLVHTRLKVRDKGLWTALLAIAGFGVMLFNWIVINFLIVGLHSYA